MCAAKQASVGVLRLISDIDRLGILKREFFHFFCLLLVLFDSVFLKVIVHCDRCISGASSASAMRG